MFKTIDPEVGRKMILMIAHTTQEQCREMGELMLALSESPRGSDWNIQMQKALENFPAPPPSDRATQLAAARKRIVAHRDREAAAPSGDGADLRHVPAP